MAHKAMHLILEAFHEERPWESTSVYFKAWDRLVSSLDEMLSQSMTSQRFLGRDEMRDRVIAWLADLNPELRDRFLEDFPE